MKALFSAIVLMMICASAMAQTFQPAVFHEFGASTSIDDYNWDHAVVQASARAQEKANVTCGGLLAQRLTEFTCRRKVAYVFFVTCGADFTCLN
jgi:hypothetical protein